MSSDARPTFESPATKMPESHFVDVDAWNKGTLKALERLTLVATSPPAIRGTTVSLTIPLDAVAAAADPRDGEEGAIGSDSRRNPPLRRKTSNRDSLRRRELLLKGKEGSRRRQKWENDHLLGNPHAQPPLPMDWEVRPTHPVHSVPYYLASLWDAKRAEGDRKAAARKLKASKTDGATQKETVGRVPKALKDTMKRSQAAKHMLHELETEVRKFAENWNEAHGAAIGASGPSSPVDEEFMLVNDDLSLESVTAFNREKLVFEGPEADQAASFGRWLVHSLGDYYGLDTWSVTIGNPARREAYVGIKSHKHSPTKKKHLTGPKLPRPLWARV